MTDAHSIEADEKGLLVACPQCGKRNRMSYKRLGLEFRCGHCHTNLPAPAEPVEVSSEEAFVALTSESRLPVLVDFWAEWCGPCKMMAPQLHQAAAESAGQFVAAKVNTEELPALAERFQITGIPTLILFRDGRIATRQSGAMASAMIKRFAATT
ncbi:MAG TPA: thioredoxin [Candidatus Dormibacteraeota bacterium]|nr:thioredoxin [Candidatus Dormibacteraeota bacterium]